MPHYLLDDIVIQQDGGAWFHFFESVISSLAWPLLIALFVWMFHRQIRDAIMNLEWFRWGNAEGRIRDRVQQAAEDAREADLPEPPEDWNNVEDIEETLYHDRWQTSARGVVLDSWEGVVDAIRKAATRAGVDIAGPRTEFSPARTRMLLDGLVKEGLIDDRFRHIVDELRTVRNEAAHAREFRLEPDVALQYSRLARQVIDALRDIRRPAPERAQERGV